MLDHSRLSPSGRVSERYRQKLLAQDRAEINRLYSELRETRQSATQPSERERDLQRASEYRELAARGMQPRKMFKLAAELEAKWT